MGVSSLGKYFRTQNRKLGSKTIDAIFISYAQNSNAYRFLVIKSDISDISYNSILEARDASFFEDIFFLRLEFLDP